MLNSVKHVGAQKKSRIVGEVRSEGGRIWREYCTTTHNTIFSAHACSGPHDLAKYIYHRKKIVLSHLITD